MKALAIALSAAVLGLYFSSSSSSIEQSFAAELQRWSPEAPQALFAVGERLTDPLDREAWLVFRAGLERVPTLPIRPTAREASIGWLTVVAGLSNAAAVDSPRRARVDFWRHLLPGFGV